MLTHLSIEGVACLLSKDRSELQRLYKEMALRMQSKTLYFFNYLVNVLSLPGRWLNSMLWKFPGYCCRSSDVRILWPRCPSKKLQILRSKRCRSARPRAAGSEEPQAVGAGKNDGKSCKNRQTDQEKTMMKSKI